jgi:hypothetical protein
VQESSTTGEIGRQIDTLGECQLPAFKTATVDAV